MTFYRSILRGTAAVAILASLAGAAVANERPDDPDRMIGARTMGAIALVPAADLYRGKELARLGLSADAEIAVTLFPSGPRVDRSSADDKRG